MADKEATVYIVDVGRSMGKLNNGREQSDLDFCMQYVWDRITTTVATGRKTAYVGVVGARTDDTNNELAEDEYFSHISVLQPLAQCLMPDIRRLKEDIKPSRTNKGDIISALVIAIQLISAHCKKLKYIRRIVLVTNGLGYWDVDDIKNITGKIKEEGIEILILGPDFDDPDYGFKEENKDETKSQNEEVLRKLADDCEGTFGTMEAAITEMSVPRIKPVRPVASFKGYLTLGDPEKYDTALQIDVERYPRIMQAKPPTASKFVVRKDEKEEGSSTQQPSASTQTIDGDAEMKDGDELAGIKTTRTYFVGDDSSPGGKKEVDAEDLAKGYEYGRTAVHISEGDRDIVDLETFAGLDIIGFVPKDKFERYMEMSRSNMIIPQKTNDKASIALSSLIHALFELESVAIARLVTKDKRQPVLVMLAPSIEPDYECLIDVEVPFAEDMRGYRFPPLDRVITVSGKTLTEHRNLPSDDLKRAMSQYVNAMDLSTFGKDEDGEPCEYLTFEDSYSPILHRVNQIIRLRAVDPTATIPPPPESLTKFSNPPEDLLKTAQPHLDAVISAADIKKVPPKQKGRKRGRRDIEKPLSGLDVGELLGREKRQKISLENAIPEFKQILSSTEDIGTIRDAAKQMAKIVESHVRQSVGDSGYGRAVECMRVMREEMIELEEPGVYNEWVREFKGRLLKGEFGGERREMRWVVKVNRVGLVVGELTGVGEEEAKGFLSARVG